MARRKQYLKVEEKPHGMHAEHPFNDEDNNEALVDYCLSRVRFAHDKQGGLKDRFERIDRELCGFLRLDKEDLTRQAANERGEATKPVKSKPQIALAQIGRGVTFLASVFSPDSGIYEALTTKDEQQFANAVVRLMNMHAVKGKYFRQLCMFFLNCLKYNIGGFRTEWVKEVGIKLEDVAGTATPKQQITYQGNMIANCNMYNTFYDPSVNPVDVHSKGEFAGEVCIKTPFQIARMVEDGTLHNVGDLLKSTGGASGRWEFYRDIPHLRFQEGNADHSADGSINWYSILTAGTVTGYNVGGIELVDIYIRLIPREFGLVSKSEGKTRKALEIWRITIASGERVVAAEYLNNIHNYLPYSFSVPREDDLGLQQMSVGEDLIPFQNMVAFQFNTYTEANRSNIWDLLIYDPTYVDLASIGNDVAARVPVLPAGYGKDLTKSIWHFNKNLEADKILQQAQTILEMMEFIFPTRMLQQVADIDRAVKDQVAAVMQASQRESWKLAKIIEDQAMTPARFVAYSNIQQYQESIEMLMPDGTTIEIDPTQLRKLNLEFKLGEGLKSVDRLAVQIFAREMLSAVLSSGAVKDMDVMGFLNYISSLNGVEADLTQFRLTPQQVATQSATAQGMTGPQQPEPQPAVAPANGAAPVVQ